MSSSLGEKLRQAREERGISISEVAEQTRISSLYLEAIDGDNYKILPGGIFNKGFVRSYAKYVGLDEQEALQDYAQLVAAHEENEEEKYKAYRPEVLTDDRAGTSIIPTVLFAVVILGLMTAGILFLVNYIQNQQSDPTVATNANIVAPANNPAANSSTVVPVSQAPTMGALKIEFTTTGDEISLNSVSDGTKAVALVTSGKPAVFEPKDQLKLSYATARSQLAQLSINGKSIALPAAPANPKRAVIEFDINKDNLASVWQSGAISFDTPAASQDANTAMPPVSALPSPASATPAAGRPTPKPSVNVAVPAANNTRPREADPSSTPVARPANNRPPANSN